MNLEDAVREELKRGDYIHGQHPTLAHAVEVLREEFDEFIEASRHGTLDEQATEITHVAAMAWKLYRDILLPQLKEAALTDPVQREIRGCDVCRQDGISKAFCKDCEDGKLFMDSRKPLAVF